MYDENWASLGLNGSVLNRSNTEFSYPQAGPPNEASSPSPEAGIADVGTDITLSWSGGDPDSADKVFYDVYLGAEGADFELVASNLEAATYNPQDLNYGTTYFWQVIARDSSGAETVGPIWTFTTKDRPPFLPFLPLLLDD